jgi:hypothetical protein
MKRAIRWEYLTVFSGPFISDDRLNELGAQGWELVLLVLGDDGWHNWIFKRERRT